MHAGGFTAPFVGAALALGLAGSALAAAPTTRTPALGTLVSECDQRTGAIMRDFGFDPLPRVVRARSGGGVDVYLDGSPTITGVRAAGPASGRLESGDVVLAIDGLPVGTSAAAARYLRVERGEQVRFTVSRGGERHDVTITTGETCVPYPPAPTATSGALAPDVPPPAAGAELLDPARFGFAIQCDACGDATVAGRTMFRFDAAPVVVAVDPDSPAARAGVRPGDRLSQIDGVSLTGDDGWTTLRSLDRATSVRLTFVRNDVPFVVQIGRSAIVPRIDHHKHSMGPGALGDAQALLPPVAVPADVGDMLRRLEERYNDAVAIREQYTENAVLHDSRVPAWYRGQKAVASFVTGRFRAPVSYTVVSFDGDAARARLAGYVTRGKAHIGHFHLSLEKGADGQWRVGAETLTFPGPQETKPVVAEDVVRELDAAGIERGVVLSVAYWFSSPEGNRAENDWAIADAAKHPQRLVVFCGIPVLAAHAVAEVERCAQRGVRGIKVHFGNSRVDILRPEHAAKVRDVFAAANRAKLAIVVHLWTIGDYEETAAARTRAFIDRVLPATPDVTVQIAHMAGGSFSNDSAMSVFARAFEARDPRVARVYFDVATITTTVPDVALAKDVAHMRRIGLDRFLWGSDMTSADNPAKLQWRVYRGLSPLTDDELRVLASNVAPYLRD